MNHRSPALSVRIERWPIAGAFAISRGIKTEAAVVVAELSNDGYVGRGECVPYARYGETADGVAATLKGMRDAVAGGLNRCGLQTVLPAGAARNALDCAFWDLEAKRTGCPVHALAGLATPRPVTTAYTISLGPPQAMEEAARRAQTRPLLKVKLGGDGDLARIAAVRGAAPRSQLIVDANEAWSTQNLTENLAACADAGVSLIEQPLPAGHDDMLAIIRRPIAVCADESVHDRGSLAGLADRYDAVNIKLDKTGGLTEALALLEQAERAGLIIMVGCMVSTSLAIAPAMLLANRARVVDLDGPLLLERDRPHGLHYDGSVMQPPLPELWG